MHNIAGFFRSDKPRDFFLALVIVAVGVGGFALGRLSLRSAHRDVALVRAPWAEAPPAPAVPEGARQVPLREAQAPAPGRVVGSLKGSVYHLPWCAGASRIKEENRRWFSSVEEAERAGYRPAANCPGLSR